MLVSKQFDEFMRMVGQGRITPERLQIFMDHPDGRIIDGDAEERMLIERLPDNSIADSLKWFDGKLCYNVMVGEKSYRLRCPEGWSARRSRKSTSLAGTRGENSSTSVGHLTACGVP